MKKFVLLLFCLGTSYASHAQFFQLGIRGGLSSYNVRYQDFTNINNFSLESNSKTGVHLGFYSRVQLAGFYVQPELLYNRTGSSITTTAPNGVSTVSDLTFQRIDVPVLAGKRFFRLFRTNAGPVFSSLVRAELEENKVSSNISTAYRNSTVGFQIGAGLDIWKLVIDLKYEGSLGKFGESINAGGQSFATDARPSQWLIAVGYRVF